MAPTLTRSSTITLGYPYGAGVFTYSVVLPAPVFENADILNQQSIIRTTRGYEPKLYRKSAWPEFETLSYIIEACTETQKNDYLTFIENTYGLDIELHDYETQEWQGIILPGEITQVHRSCGYVITFEFQGEHKGDVA